MKLELLYRNQQIYRINSYGTGKIENIMATNGERKTTAAMHYGRISITVRKVVQSNSKCVHVKGASIFSRSALVKYSVCCVDM